MGYGENNFWHLNCFEPSSQKHSAWTCSSQLQEETTEKKICMCFSIRIFICIWTVGEKIRWKASFSTCGICWLLESQNLPHFTRDESKTISTMLSNPDWNSTDHGFLYATYVPGSSFKEIPERGERERSEMGKK